MVATYITLVTYGRITQANTYGKSLINDTQKFEENTLAFLLTNIRRHIKPKKVSSTIKIQKHHGYLISIQIFLLQISLNRFRQHK